ncbi:MAG: HigA family addiction module antitoxin [Hyphomicrobiaceae bacterium]|nr:HigA family addiction module antitoxin [Hyphomicrobiaceae bacterium]
MHIKDIFDRSAPPPHPGEVLREDILPKLRLSRAEVARHLKVSARSLGDLLRERRGITLDLAMRLGTAFGQGAHFWLALQMQHDLWLAAQGEPPQVRRLDARDYRAQPKSSHSRSAVATLSL